MRQDDGIAGPHPDLRRLYCDALSELRDRIPGSHLDMPGILAGLRPDDLTVRCRRTWYDVRSISPDLDGGDYSASIVQFSAGGHHFSFFIEAIQPVGDDEGWQWKGASGGELAREALDDAGGFSIAGGSYACVGGLTGSHKSFAAIQIEHADGARYTAQVADDGSVMVLAPVVSAPSPDDDVILRYLDAAGNILSESRTWIGDGSPPPTETPPGREMR